MKYLFFLIFSTALFSNDICYSVQLSSQSNSEESRKSLLSNTYDNSCKIVEVSNLLKVRCGCFDSSKEARSTLPTFSKKYKGAFVVTSEKSAFGITSEKVAPVTAPGEAETLESTMINTISLKDLSVASTSSCVEDVKVLLSETYANYPSIKASRNLILSKQAQVEGAKWNYFPTPSVSYSQGAERQTATIGLEQPLWTGGKLDAKTDLAVSEHSKSKAMLGENLYSVTEEFLSILRSYVEAKEQIKGFTEGKEQLSEFLEMIQRRITAGASSITDRDLLNSRIAQVDSDLSIAKSKFRVAQSQLALYVGRPIDCEIGFDDDQFVQGVSLDLMKEGLLSSHPEIKRLEAQIGIAKAEKKGSEAALMPTISLKGEHQTGSMYGNDQANDSSVYVSVTYTPGAGLSSLSNIESAQYNVLQAKSELNTTKIELLSALVSSFENYHSIENQLISINKTIGMSESVLHSYNRLFVAGKKQWLDLVNMSREVTENRVSMASIKAAYTTASYRLALQSGNINFGGKENDTFK